VKRLFFVLAVLALLAAALSAFASPAQAAGSLTYHGEITPANTYDDYPFHLEAGETITVRLDCAPGSPLDPYLQLFSSSMTLLADADDNGGPCLHWYSAYIVFTAPASDTYIIRATSFDYAVGPSWNPGPNGAYILTISSEGWCNPVAIPAGSVVGTFLTDTVAHWAPGKQTEPPVVFTAGKTAWVVGIDESGEYYQLAYLCNYLWVPVESMGPNYDAVWNGTPLPTGAVK